MIPYGHQSIDEDDIQAVVSVLRSDYLTQGPLIPEFERALAEYCGARYAVVASSGTAALHAAYYAAGLERDDEFITSPMTFPATSNAALWQGARPVFVDVESNTGNINADLIAAKINKRTKAIVPIDYTGRPAELEAITALAKKHNLVVIEDACQALGAVYHGKKIGSVSDLTVFSFHPVKSITTGEGGAVLTDDEAHYRKMKSFVTHGVVRDHFEHPSPGDWYFEMQALGQNFRLTDFQCALGLSQLSRLDAFIERRREIAGTYHRALSGMPTLQLPEPDTDSSTSSWHLYVIRLNGKLVSHKAEIFRKLRAAGIGVAVHHIPVYLHPFYHRLGYVPGLCPRAEEFYASALSLPIFPNLTNMEQDRIIAAVRKNVGSVL